MVGFELACRRGVPAPSSVVGSISGKAGTALVLIETAATDAVAVTDAVDGTDAAPAPEDTAAEDTAAEDTAAEDTATDETEPEGDFRPDPDPGLGREGDRSRGANVKGRRGGCRGRRGRGRRSRRGGGGVVGHGEAGGQRRDAERQRTDDVGDALGHRDDGLARLPASPSVNVRCLRI